MVRKLAALWCLAAMLCGGVVQAKVAIIAERTSSAVYINTTDGSRIETQQQLDAVTALLDRWHADYKIIHPSVAHTEYCRTGLMVYTPTGSGTTPSYEQFDAVIHVAYNGTSASLYSGYRPDSLTVGANYPTVPQLFLVADQLESELGGNVLNTTVNDSCGAAANAWAFPMGSGNHEGEGTCFGAAGGNERFFDAAYGASVLRSATQPTGGSRVLMCVGANSVIKTIERTGQPTSNPDSVQTAVTDTMKVWERLNANKSGSARIVFATAFALSSTDSTSTAGPGQPNTPAGVNWPVLLCAIAHLDSLAGGKVLGSNVVPGVGFIITHAGDRSARANPGGIHSADTTYLQQSCDSIGVRRMKVVIAADPESLIAHPSDIAMWKRIGANLRITPFVRTGMDTLGLAASANNLIAHPVDVWGRYRNRTFLGDSVAHFADGKDSSICASLYNAKNMLATAAPGVRISNTVIAPDFDASPFQLRRTQNVGQFDSVYIAMRLNGFTTLIQRNKGRDSDPNYLATPIGWLAQERVVSLNKFGITGSATQLCVNTVPVWGSTKLTWPSAADTTPPYCDVTCPLANVAVSQENMFWNGFFFQAGRDYQVNPYDNTAISGPFIDSRDLLYGARRASVLVLAAQSLGGGIIEFGSGHIEHAADNPARPGWLIMKHIYDVISLANRFAGHPIIKQDFPENIQP